MWRLLFLFSILPIAAALIARWWFGLRVIEECGGAACRCDLEKWTPSVETSSSPQRAEQPAAEFGRQLRLSALADWRISDPKAAASRENSRRFGIAVPPLSGIVAVMAIIVAKSPQVAISLFLAAVAFSAVVGLLSIAPELVAISAAAKKLRDKRCFVRRDDEDAVVRCAMAYAWKETLPPIFSLLQR
jgi:hypothetical protein